MIRERLSSLSFPEECSKSWQPHIGTNDDQLPFETSDP